VTTRRTAGTFTWSPSESPSRGGPIDGRSAQKVRVRDASALDEGRNLVARPVFGAVGPGAGKCGMARPQKFVYVLAACDGARCSAKPSSSMSAQSA
jgi:hypothetical protein